MPDRTIVDQPGVYPDITADDYHADCVKGGSLSSSGARKLLPPGCPALYRYERENPPDPKPHFDIGHAAHKLVLGVGPHIYDTGLEDRRGNAWKTAEEACRSEGKIPLRHQDYCMVQDMAEELADHPLARLLFDPDHGTPEATLVWDDERTGVHRRARLDWLPSPRAGRLIIPDYKTCARGNLDALTRATHEHGYHVQDAWNRAGCEALRLSDLDTAFVFVFQEKTPPYLVTVVQLDHTARQIGDALCRQALDVFAECKRTDRWPGYATDDTEPEPLALPAWVERQYEG